MSRRSRARARPADPPPSMNHEPYAALVAVRPQDARWWRRSAVLRTRGAALMRRAFETDGPACPAARRCPAAAGSARTSLGRSRSNRGGIPYGAITRLSYVWNRVGGTHTNTTIRPSRALRQHKYQMGRPIGPGALQRQGHTPMPQPRQALLPERRPTEIPAELREPGRSPAATCAAPTSVLW